MATPESRWVPGARGAHPGGPLARAAELELQLRDESLRRERAEIRARDAEERAEQLAVRVDRLRADAEAAREARARDADDRRALVATLHRELAGLGDELDGLRVLAAAAPPAEPPPVAPARTVDPSARMSELARGARELLAGGRLEAADEVIRGLEDAAERLRAQAPQDADAR